MIFRNKFAVAAAAIAISAVLGTAGDAKAESAIGSLRCDVSGGISFIFGSTRELECVYNPDRGQTEFYKGRIKKFGVDLGFVRSGVIVWTVFSPALARGPGELAGSYVGGSASVAVGPGITANALFGTNKITLNPLSVGGVTGLNVAAGITDLDLVEVGVDDPYDDDRPRRRDYR